MIKNAKCEKAGSKECKKGSCTIYGTNYCIDAMPQPGTCTIRPCTRVCKIWGTDFCVGGKIKQIKQDLDLDSLTKGLNPEKILKDVDLTSMLKKFKK